MPWCACCGQKKPPALAFQHVEEEFLVLALGIMLQADWPTSFWMILLSLHPISLWEHRGYRCALTTSGLGDKHCYSQSHGFCFALLSCGFITQPRLVLNSQESLCFGLLSDGVTGLSHSPQLPLPLLNAPITSCDTLFRGSALLSSGL